MIRALIVDDDPHMLGLIETVAAVNGLEAHGCANAEEAWELFRNQEFGLVLLDWILPGMDGLELCRKMRAHPRGQDTEILIITARKGPQDLKAVLDAGADDYIAKPVSPEVLSVRIAIALRFAQNLVARARAESRLRETEHRLSAVVTAAPITIFSLNEAGRVTLVHGTALGDVLGDYAGDTLHPDTSPSTDPVGGQFVDVVRNFPAAVEAVHTALGGNTSSAVIESGGRVLELRMSPMAGIGDSWTVSGVATEVTERVHMAKRLEATLHRVERANADLVEILDQLHAGTVVVESDGRVGHVSRMAANLFDLNAQDAVGQQWNETLPLSPEAISTLQSLSRSAPKDRERIVVRVDAGDGKQRTLGVDVFDDPREEDRTFLVFYDESEVHDLRRLLDDRATFHDLVGGTPAMISVYDQIRDLAGVGWTVLISGETGTGKELVARAMHTESPQRDKRFIAVNCAGLSVSLLQSQLFGHRKGAFTGATHDQPGFFEAANGGTLFLDEIGDISPEVQTALLRVLEDGEITRVGESRPRKVDVRVITATHRDLQEEVAKGNFRADLMYRIRVARIMLPPLRERRADIPLLVNRFLERASAATGKPLDGLTEAAMSALFEYAWPGNVRELRSAIDFAAVRTRTTTVDRTDLPPELRNLGSTTGEYRAIARDLDETERIRAALKTSDGNRTKAARLLGISRATFYRRLADLDTDL